VLDPAEHNRRDSVRDTPRDQERGSEEFPTLDVTFQMNGDQKTEQRLPSHPNDDPAAGLPE